MFKMTNKTYKIIEINNDLEKEIDNTHIIMMLLKQYEYEQSLPFAINDKLLSA